MCLLIKYNKTLQISYGSFHSPPAVVILIQQIICFREISYTLFFHPNFRSQGVIVYLTSKHLLFPVAHVITA